MADKGKSSKQGRQKKTMQNLRYINERRHAKSHLRRTTKHCKSHPNDKVAEKAREHFYVTS
jgi:hypothetical protein